mgnify:CR=1 FL=1
MNAYGTKMLMSSRDRQIKEHRLQHDEAAASESIHESVHGVPEMFCVGITTYLNTTGIVAYASDVIEPVQPESVAETGEPVRYGTKDQTITHNNPISASQCRHQR